ncbi:MAG: hypothetical protein Q9200_006003, partial [Gallowayella weberi]
TPTPTNNIKNRHIRPHHPRQPRPNLNRRQRIHAKTVQRHRRIHLPNIQLHHRGDFPCQTFRDDSACVVDIGGGGGGEEVLVIVFGRGGFIVVVVSGGRTTSLIVVEGIQVIEKRAIHIQRFGNFLPTEPCRRLHARDDLAIFPRELQGRIAAIFHQGQKLGFFDTDVIFRSQRSGEIVPLGEVAYAADVCEVDGDSFGAVGDAVMGEGVEVGVSGGVVCLAVAADDAGVGGEEDEEVEVLGEEGVEVPGAEHFGLQDGVEVRMGHCGEGFVLFFGTVIQCDFLLSREIKAYPEDHGTLYATSDGRHGL